MSDALLWFALGLGTGIAVTLVGGYLISWLFLRGAG